jgi:hypothetical protein
MQHHATQRNAGLRSIVKDIMAHAPVTAILASATLPTWDRLPAWWKVCVCVCVCVCLMLPLLLLPTWDRLPAWWKVRAACVCLYRQTS